MSWSSKDVVTDPLAHKVITCDAGDDSSATTTCEDHSCVSTCVKVSPLSQFNCRSNRDGRFLGCTNRITQSQQLKQHIQHRASSSTNKQVVNAISQNAVHQACFTDNTCALLCEPGGLTQCASGPLKHKQPLCVMM